jgi:hypothetical protein
MMSAHVPFPTNPPRNPDRGFALFVSTVALILSMAALLAVAFKLDANSSAPHPMAATSMPAMSGQALSGSVAATAPTENVKIVIKSDEEHGKKGPEGVWHDAFLPGNFSVKAGSVVQVTVYNYDEGVHSFTAPGLETNAEIAAGTESKPAVTTFTIRAPEKAGRFLWFCARPCDPWAMNTVGYMRGYVTVT